MIRHENLISDPARLQYLGLSGITRPCIEAIARIFHWGEVVKIAWLLTYQGTHAFILCNHNGDLFVIKAGFGSGYRGERPRGLATALQILHRHNVDIQELDISRNLMQRLNQASLTYKDLEKLAETPPASSLRWTDYVFSFSESLDLSNEANLYYPLEIPFGLIDERIFDLALSFTEDADAAVIGAYRRLEDVVRERSGITESGAKLFSKAFVTDSSPLFWDLPDGSESKGRGNLFTAVYTAFRNARAHRELSLSRKQELREFLLINELFLLESEALDRLTSDGL